MTHAVLGLLEHTAGFPDGGLFGAYPAAERGIPLYAVEHGVAALYAADLGNDPAVVGLEACHYAAGDDERIVLLYAVSLYHAGDGLLHAVGLRSACLKLCREGYGKLEQLLMELLFPYEFGHLFRCI
jgi:hypothetical protein